mgnify:CR=1 FL=1
MPRWILAVSLFCFSAACFACLNAYDGELTRRLDNALSKEQLTGEKDRLEAAYRANNDYKVGNDLAVVLLLLGNSGAAIELLEGIERQRSGPEMYRTAVNLGTAYELAGQNAKALDWIKEGVRRNPMDHEGTEWLHVKILEAKVEMEKLPGWLGTHYVSGVDFGSGERPEMPAALPRDFLGNEKSLAELDKALTYQLGERMRLVSRPDAVVADLLMARGDVRNLLGRPKYYVSYELALEYQGSKQEILERRMSTAVAELALKFWLGIAVFSGAVFYALRMANSDSAGIAAATAVPDSVRVASPLARGGREFAGWVGKFGAAFSLVFRGWRVALWTLVLAWGAFWYLEQCHVGTAWRAGSFLMLGAISALAAWLHAAKQTRSAAGTAIRMYSIRKWFLANLVGIAGFTLVYAGSLILALPKEICGSCVGSGFEFQFGWFMAAFAFLVMIALWKLLEMLVARTIRVVNKIRR